MCSLQECWNEFQYMLPLFLNLHQWHEGLCQVHGPNSLAVKRILGSAHAWLTTLQPKMDNLGNISAKHVVQDSD